MSDRQAITDFFLVTIGGGVLAGIAYMLSKEGDWQFPHRDQALVALILFFNASGWLHFMQLLRMRQAWVECAGAMGHIKQFFVMHHEYPPDIAKKAFRWSIESIPNPGKRRTIFYMSAQLISILCAPAIFLSSSILLGIEKLNESYFIPTGLALYHFFFQMSMCTALLDDTSSPK